MRKLVEAKKRKKKKSYPKVGASLIETESDKFHLQHPLISKNFQFFINPKSVESIGYFPFQFSYPDFYSTIDSWPRAGLFFPFFIDPVPLSSWLSLSLPISLWPFVNVPRFVGQLHNFLFFSWWFCIGRFLNEGLRGRNECFEVY